MEVRPGYKQTEVGVIPKEWDSPELGSLLKSMQLGGNYKNSERESNWPLIKMGNLSRGNIKLDKLAFIDPSQPPTVRDRLRKDDVLFNTRNTLDLVGKVALWREELPEAYFNSNLMRMDFDETRVSSKSFMNAILNTPQSLRSMREIAIGTTSVAAIYSRDLVKIKISLPTKAEQEAIADALSDADALIESMEQLIAKKRQIKQGAMQELLTGKKRLPGFSGEWEVKTLPEICRFRGGKAHEQFISDSGQFVCVNSKFISSEGTIRKYTSANFCSAKRNDVLMVMSDLPNGKALAKAFLVDKDDLYAVNQRVCALTAYYDDPKFLFHLFNRNPYFLKFDDGVNQTHLLNSVFLNCCVSMPPTKEEQTAISDILSDMNEAITALEEKLAKARQVKQGMMQELLTGKIRLVS